jgi:hypothetical protein
MICRVSGTSSFPIPAWRLVDWKFLRSLLGGSEQVEGILIVEWRSVAEISLPGLSPQAK